jgi:general secretion pathway protein D
MNTRRMLLLSYVTRVLAVVVVVGEGVREIAAQPTTETKIRLMADALRAKDAGELKLAKKNLEQLSVLGPTDPRVQGLLHEVDGKLIGLELIQAETGPDLDFEAERLARAESDRLRRLMNEARDNRRAARELAREGRRDEARAVLQASISDLPLNPLTQDLRRELQAEKAAMERGLEATPSVAGPSKAQENLETVAPVADAVARLANRARSQYRAGEPAAAAETFRAVLVLDAGHVESRAYLDRIAREAREVAERHRASTRMQLLSEVDQSWQRPGVYQAREAVEDAEARTAPLARKLEEIMLPTVSFTRVEIGRVVSALSAASEEFDVSDAMPKGVNIVLLDPAAKAPMVSITLRNTNLKRVLDFVTESVGYQYEVQADAVVVRPGGEAASLATAFFPVTRATVLRMTGLGGGPATGVRRAADPFSSTGASNDAVPGGEAGSMRIFLQQAGVNFDTVPGSDLAYDGSAIIVTQTARNLERISNILNRYNDIRQVEIEAKFMEVQEGALEELGVNWNVATKATQQNAGAQAKYLTGNRTLQAAFSNTTSNQQGSIVRPESETMNADGSVAITPELNIPIINNAPQIPGIAYLGAGANALANITGVIGEFDVNAIIRALSQQQGTDLLSAPRVTVLSGNPATMTVAQELRYPQSFGQTQSQVGTGNASGGGSAGVAITAGTPQEFATRNVGVELRVTPTVEEDDYSISLDLNPKVTEFDGFVEYGGPSVAISGSTTVTVPSGFYQPIFSVRDISTKVTIWDGATLIMGGLTREEVKKVNDKVPVLGDLPLLGRMFRSKGESAQKRNLLIFVTANLVSPGGAPKKQALQKTAPNSLFQNPVIITPAGAEVRREE